MNGGSIEADAFRVFSVYIDVGEDVCSTCTCAIRRVPLAGMHTGLHVCTSKGSISAHSHLHVCVCFTSGRTGLMICLHALMFRGGFTVPVLASEDKGGGWDWNIPPPRSWFSSFPLHASFGLAPRVFSLTLCHLPSLIFFSLSHSLYVKYLLSRLNAEYRSLLFSAH